jgi:hypothetical protein
VQFPLGIELRRSRGLTWLLILLHLLAGGCLWLPPWPAAARWLLLAMVALSGWRALRASQVVGLRLGDRGELVLLSVAGDCPAVTVLPDTAVFSRLIVLRLREDDDRGRRRSLTLLPDSMPPGQFRLLRLWLRWLANARSERLPATARD